VARHAEAGQFVIIRPLPDSERIPLTIAGADAKTGLVRIIFAAVGETTLELSRLCEGEAVADIAGPLGKATETDGLSRVLVVGGGVGCAIALPIARKLASLGCEVHSVIGFREDKLVILEDDFKEASASLTVVTDDGSYGERGNVTLPIRRMLEGGERFDKIIAIGPLVMMKFVTETARPFGIPVTVSMNPIMIDGTGMCGGCRLQLIKDGKRTVSFACVDGPDFNGYEVDFDEAMERGAMYREFERHAHDEACNLFKKEVQ
jgi:ferredoxin--NADP+ reductase